MKCTPINKIVLELNEHECKVILDEINSLLDNSLCLKSQELKFLLDYLKKGCKEK
jgi:hypothetical protein